jgi:iron-sulfur cluster assembly protein
MLSLTEKAAFQMKKMMTAQNLTPETIGVRVGVKPAGCSGMAYTIDFEDRMRDGDEVIDARGIKIYLDPAASPYLEGTEIDWQDGLMHSGFKFNNPQARKTCGCGESFTV